MYRVFACSLAGGLLMSLLIVGCDKKQETEAIGKTISTSQAPADEPPQLIGNHGGTDCQFIYGWAYDKKHPEQVVKVDIYDGEKLIATVAADVLRKDLVKSKIGTGKHGIVFKLPASLRDGKEHTIRIRFAGTQKDLGNTPKKITCSEKDSAPRKDSTPRKESTPGKPKDGK